MPQLKDLSHVIQTLSMLSAVGQMDKKTVYEFVESLYIKENGGFGPQPGYGSTPPSTYYGILCLERLGKLQGLLQKVKKAD